MRKKVSFPVANVVKSRVKSDKQLSDQDSILGSTHSFMSDKEETKRTDKLQATDALKRAVYKKT